MTDDTDVTARGPGRAPWVVAAVLVVLVAALTLLLVHVDRVRADRSAAGYGPTADQRAAVQAAAIEAANTISFRHDHFAADYQRALDGMTGALRKDFADPKNRNAAEQTTTRNKLDLRATVVNSAFESQVGDQVLALVTLDATQVTSAGMVSAPTTQRLEMTMVQQDGRWLAANLTSVGIQ